MAHISDQVSPNYLNLLELVSMINGVSVNCMLDSGAMHSFAHTRIVKSMEMQPSQCDVLTVTVTNSSNSLGNDVCTLDLTFTAEGGDRQVTV